MLHRIIMLPALLLLSGACDRPPASIGAQTGTAREGLELPLTPAGIAARSYLSAFNSGDPERMRAFVQEFADPSPRVSLDERVQSYLTAYELVGPVRLLSIDPSTDTELVLRAHSARHGELGVIFIVDQQPPHHVQGIYFEPDDR